LKAQVRLNTEMLQNLTKMVEDLVRCSGAGGGVVARGAAKLPADVNLPLQTVDQVRDLELLLSQPAEKQKLVTN